MSIMFAISLANKTDQGNPQSTVYEIYGIQEGALVSWSSLPLVTAKNVLVLQNCGVFYRNPEIWFKHFFLTDSCSQDLSFKNLTGHLVIIEHFEIFKMASRTVAKYMLSLVLLCLGLEYLFLFTTFGC